MATDEKAPVFGVKIKGLEQLTEMREQLPAQRKMKRNKAQNDYEKTLDQLLTLWQQCVEHYEELPRVVQNATRAATRQMNRYRGRPGENGDKA